MICILFKFKDSGISLKQSLFVPQVSTWGSGEVHDGTSPSTSLVINIFLIKKE